MFEEKSLGFTCSTPGGGKMDAKDTLPRLVYQHASSAPDRIALTSIGQGSVTWAELWKTSRQWAGWLENNGVKSGDCVVTLVPQSLEANFAWMGCCAIGAVEASVNYEFRGEWLRNALSSSTAKVVVLSKRYLNQLLPVLDGTGIETVLLYDDTAADVVAGVPPGVRIVRDPPSAARSIADGPPDTAPYDIGCILYTSGTTGRSKAVQLPWVMLYASCELGARFERRDIRQVYYLPYTPYHISGRSALYCAAITCSQTVIRENFSISSFWKDIRQYGVTWTCLFGAPTRFVANLPEKPDDADNSLELVLMCPLPPDADAIKRRFGFEAYSVYGLTEAQTTFVVPPEEAVSANAGSCGRPMPGIEARIVDEHGYPVEPGVAGELVFRSDDPWRITPGYVEMPEATAEIWRNGWFHTGDVGRMDNKGNFYYLDRSKDMIRRRGENISSFELEAAVRTHPSVGEVAAVGVPSPLGEEEVLIVVVAKRGMSIDPADLTSHLTEIVPRYAVPRYVRVAETLPKTQATERVQKHAIRAQGLTDDTWDRLGTKAHRE
ncbi:MAG: AMP-binding protein [Syntrophales bacterium]|nr:AMP-binding protein [Syntrophales bacterium]